MLNCMEMSKSHESPCTDDERRLDQQHIIDTVNSMGYDVSNPNEMCPERKVYVDLPKRPCRFLYSARCNMLDHGCCAKGARVGGRTEIAFNICFDLGGHIENAIPDSIGCEARAKLLELYDKAQASGKFSTADSNFCSAAHQLLCTLSVGEKDQLSAYMRADYNSLSDIDKEKYNTLKRIDAGCITGLDGEEDFYGTKIGKTPYSDEAMAVAYEKWQYEARKRLGEPVIFHNGRCLFDGTLPEAGIFPGPFPGLDLYRYEKKLLDPDVFRRWLDESESMRKQSGLPPVAYIGQPLCALRFRDVLLYYSTQHSVIGSETYRLFVKKHPMWVKQLFEDFWY